MLGIVINYITRFLHTFGRPEPEVRLEPATSFNDVDYDALETPAFFRRLSSFGELIAGDIEQRKTSVDGIARIPQYEAVINTKGACHACKNRCRCYGLP